MTAHFRAKTHGHITHKYGPQIFRPKCKIWAMVKKRTSPRRQEACPFIYGASQALLTFWRNAGASYYRARYYDPSSGRFLSEDPIAFQGGGNFYTYVLNRPLNYVDPEGNIPLPLITAGIGAIAGGVGDLAGQEINNFRQGKSLKNVDFKEVVVATGVGAAAGAAAPFVAVTWTGAAILVRIIREE